MLALRAQAAADEVTFCCWPTRQNAMHEAHPWPNGRLLAAPVECDGERGPFRAFPDELNR